MQVAPEPRPVRAPRAVLGENIRHHSDGDTLIRSDDHKAPVKLGSEVASQRQLDLAAYPIAGSIRYPHEFTCGGAFHQSGDPPVFHLMFASRPMSLASRNSTLSSPAYAKTHRARLAGRVSHSTQTKKGPLSQPLAASTPTAINLP